MKFLDQVKIYIKAGNGGDGSPSFRREKYEQTLQGLFKPMKEIILL